MASCSKPSKRILSHKYICMTSSIINTFQDLKYWIEHNSPNIKTYKNKKEKSIQIIFLLSLLCSGDNKPFKILKYKNFMKLKYCIHMSEVGVNHFLSKANTKTDNIYWYWSPTCCCTTFNLKSSRRFYKMENSVSKVL